MFLKMPAHALSFRHWIREERENNRLLIMSSIAVLIQFVVFKILYPFAYLTDESYWAIEAAHKNWSIGYLPVGYPMFLRLVSSFTSSDTILVLVQYGLLQAAILYFLFSLKFLLSMGTWISRILIGLSVLNPFLLYVSNLVTYDSLVAALMLGWFTHLLWVMYQPRLFSLLKHSVLLILLFMVNHNTWYCAMISVFVFFFLPMPKRSMLIGIGALAVLFGAFIGGTQTEFNRRSGKAQFSAQWGWQKAANVLYGYAHTDTLDRQKVRGRFRDLHGIVNEYVARVNKLPAGIRSDRGPNDHYLREEGSPLNSYMREVWVEDDSSSAFKKWASIGPIYAQYGNFLINEYPSLYWQYYILPNLKNYYVPETETLTSYNRLRDTVRNEAVDWFQWESNKVFTVFKDRMLKVPYNSTMPIAVIKLLFVLSFFAVFFAGGFSSVSLYVKQLLIFLMFTWLANLIFSVLSTPIVLRQQVFVMQLTFTFGVLFMYILGQLAFLEKPKKLISPANFQSNPL